MIGNKNITMTIQDKLLSINRIKLPVETLEIIKSYAFYDFNIEKKKHKETYHQTSREISNSISKGSPLIGDIIFPNSIYRMFITKNRNLVLQYVICRICGNYKCAESGMYTQIACFCQIENQV